MMPLGCLCQLQSESLDFFSKHSLLNWTICSALMWSFILSSACQRSSRRYGAILGLGIAEEPSRRSIVHQASRVSTPGSQLRTGNQTSTFRSSASLRSSHRGLPEGSMDRDPVTKTSTRCSEIACVGPNPWVRSRRRRLISSARWRANVMFESSLVLRGPFNPSGSALPTRTSQSEVEGVFRWSHAPTT